MQCVVLVTKLIIELARTFRSTCKCVVLLIKAVFILCRRAFVRARKPYRKGFLFRHKNGDFSNEAALRQSLKWSVTYRIGVHAIQDSYSGRDEKLSGRV